MGPKCMSGVIIKETKCIKFVFNYTIKLKVLVLNIYLSSFLIVHNYSSQPKQKYKMVHVFFYQVIESLIRKFLLLRNVYFEIFGSQIFVKENFYVRSRKFRKIMFFRESLVSSFFINQKNFITEGS